MGGVGPKSLDLLHSALYRPHVGYDGEYKWSDPYDLVATVLYGLVKDHPFHDANKRTAFLSTLFLLKKMSLQPNVGQKDFEDFLVEIAEGAYKRRSRYKELSQITPDPEILYISWWLKKHTRPCDRRQYLITFRELKKILNRFGYDLENPFRNYIDVVQVKQTPLLNLLKGQKEVRKKNWKIRFSRLD